MEFVYQETVEAEVHIASKRFVIHLSVYLCQVSFSPSEYLNNSSLSTFSCTSRYVGEFCEYTNPCLTAPRCQNGGTCETVIRDGQVSFQCKCPLGFSASLCEIFEENACSSSPCKNNGKCSLKSLKEYECRCPEGFFGNLFCVYIKFIVLLITS